tara:strand:- start:464 stop:1582 length:1119 start_codon:yes stop_codon:yes gene_type:complete
MNICHVVTGFGGGVYTSVRQIVSCQRSMGHKVAIVRDFRGPYPAADLEDYPENVKFFEWDVPREISPATDWRAFRRLYGILRRERPDIVHLHCAKAGFIGRIAARMLGIPAVYSPRGLPFYRADVSGLRRRIYFVLEYLLARFGGTIVACSGREFTGVERLTRRRKLISNGIDLADIGGDGTRSAHGGAPHPFTIVTVGLINYARNPELVSALALRSPPDWRWIWIGDGELRKVLDGHPRIETPGWMPRGEALHLMSAVDVQLHPSKWEGLPLVVLEGMALGLPVVASNIVGNADVIEDGKSGFLIDDDEDYLGVLAELADNENLRGRIGAAARRRVEQEFSAGALVPRWVELYRDEIARKSRRREAAISGT